MTDSVVSLTSVQTIKIQYSKSMLGPRRADRRMAITKESQLSQDLKGQRAEEMALCQGVFVWYINPGVRD